MCHCRASGKEKAVADRASLLGQKVVFLYDQSLRVVEYQQALFKVLADVVPLSLVYLISSSLA